MIGIYKITNLINNKVYIGQSIKIQRRLGKHKTTAFNPKDKSYHLPLYRALRKYGINQFTFEVIEECLLEELIERETFWIQYYNSTNKELGYNLTIDGQIAGHSVFLSKEEVLEIIQLLKNTKFSQKEIAKLYEVSRQMISEICLGNSWVQPNEFYPLREKNVLHGNIRKRTVIKCIDCEKEIDYRAIRCNSCHQIAQRQVERPSRDELKQLIRKISFVELGKQFNVSDNAIRKWCDAYKLPKKKSEINKYNDNEWNKI